MFISVLCQINLAHITHISMSQQEVVNFSEYMNAVKLFSKCFVVFIMILVVGFPVFIHFLS